MTASTSIAISSVFLTGFEHEAFPPCLPHIEISGGLPKTKVLRVSPIGADTTSDGTRVLVAVRRQLATPRHVAWCPVILLSDDGSYINRLLEILMLTVC